MRPFDYLLYAGVVFAWSTSWYPLSLQMGVVEAEVSLVWRFTAAAVLMFAITAWFRVPLRYGRAEHIRFAMLGIVLFSTNFALYYNASLYAASGLLAVILSTASLVNVLMVAVITHRPPPVLQLGAAVTGLAGVGLIFLPELQLSPTVVLALLLSWRFGHAQLLHRQPDVGGKPEAQCPCPRLDNLGHGLWNGVHGDCFAHSRSRIHH